MKLWLISQDHNRGYDTYDCAVVIAETEQEARRIDLGGEQLWALPEHVKVKYIGEATEGLKGELATGDNEAVICASFNAG